VGQQLYGAASHLWVRFETAQKVIAPKYVYDTRFEGNRAGNSKLAFAESRLPKALLWTADLQGDLLTCLADREDALSD
jgi:hypothetical protein